jgi:hypothetical protein
MSPDELKALGEDIKAHGLTSSHAANERAPMRLVRVARGLLKPIFAGRTEI